jgi:Peptidase family M23.
MAGSSHWSRIPSPNAYGGEYRAVHIRDDDGRLYTMRYVEPQGQDGQAIQAGQRINEGARVGTVQDRARQDRTGRMQNHVHVEIRDRRGRMIDPEPEIRPQRRGR